LLTVAIRRSTSTGSQNTVDFLLKNDYVSR
jgi:hypothetical protein